MTSFYIRNIISTVNYNPGTITVSGDSFLISADSIYNLDMLPGQSDLLWTYDESFSTTSQYRDYPSNYPFKIGTGYQSKEIPFPTYVYQNEYHSSMIGIKEVRMSGYINTWFGVMVGAENFYTRYRDSEWSTMGWTTSNLTTFKTQLCDYFDKSVHPVK